MHFGLNMCSPCLRRTKRETKPSFYLGTCYSEMTRRCKHFDIVRPKYVGKNICTKEEFINRFLNDPTFLELFKGWQESGFKRGDAPSIDRIDNNGSYLIDNLQFLKHSDHNSKTHKNKITDREFRSQPVIDNLGIRYESITECAKKNKVSVDNIKKYILLGRKLNGKKYKYA